MHFISFNNNNNNNKNQKKYKHGKREREYVGMYVHMSTKEYVNLQFFNPMRLYTKHSN